MAVQCCYTCLNYEDALCLISNRHDDEDPNIFMCELYDEDTEETNLFKDTE